MPRTFNLLCGLSFIALAAPALGQGPAPVPVATQDAGGTSGAVIAAAKTALDGDAMLDDVEDYLVLNQPVAAFLEMLARDRDVRLTLTDRVRGTIAGMRLSGSVSEILDNLAEAHALDWFAFNGVIHVSARGEATTRLIRLGDLDSDHAIDILDEAGLALDRYPVRATAERSTVAISGPPRMLAVAEAVIESIPRRQAAGPAPRATRRMITVRRGNVVERSNIAVAD